MCLFAAGLAVLSLSTPKAQARADRRSNSPDLAQSRAVAAGCSADAPEVRKDGRALRKPLAAGDAQERRAMHVECRVP
jgi:hypothetical protein